MSPALERYRRQFTPDLEVGPREPVHVVELVSAKNVSFTLVGEALGAPEAGRDLAWLIWREDACVAFVGGNLAWRQRDPFRQPFAPLRHGERLHPQRAFVV